MDKVKVMILEDEGYFRYGLEAKLIRDDNIEVLGTSGDPDQFLDMLEQHQPNVVTIDLMFRGTFDIGLSVIENIKQKYPNIRILVLTSFTDIIVFMKCLLLKVDGFMIKSIDIDTPPTISDIIINLSKGKGHFESSLVLNLRDYIKLPNTIDQISSNRICIHITPRQQEILDLLIKNYSYAEIAEQLFISPNTVKTHIENLFTTFNVNNRTKLVQAVLLQGISNTNENV
jgi:DNA-binding NarL/FixJ family response regulator